MSLAELKSIAGLCPEVVSPVTAVVKFITNKGDTFDDEKTALMAHYQDEIEKLMTSCAGLVRVVSYGKILANRDEIIKLLKESKIFLPTITK